MDSFTLDWLSFTVPGSIFSQFYLDPEHMLHELSLYDSETYEDLGRGFQGYKYSASICQTGRVAWGGQNDTFYVSLPASALAWLKESHLIRDFEGWLSFLDDLGVKVRRLDFAFDDKSMILDLDILFAFLESGDVVTRFKTFDEVSRRQIGEDVVEGRTLYVGNRQGGGDRLIRFYDKAAEQGVLGHWIRCELQVISDRAMVLFQQWRQAAFSVGYAAAYLNDALAFVFRNDEDVNKSRWPLADWWLFFLEVASKVKAVIPGRVRDVEDVFNWLAVQVCTSLYLVEKLKGKGALDALLDMGRARYGPLQKAIERVSVGA